MMEPVEYHGWKNNLALSNGTATVIVTLDVGPRIISYALNGQQNVLKNYTEMLGKTGEDEWQIRGGHRFWLAPEDTTRTYFADNAPVAYQQLGELSARFTPPPEKPYHVQKEMEVHLAPNGSRITVRLKVTNIGNTPTTLAPWGPTVMAPGGVEIIPLPEKKPHPGHPSNCKTPFDYGPNQELILWPYFDFTDKRWTFGSRYILLRQDSQKGPTKIGLAHRLGWTAYLNGGQLFIKRFPYVEGATYPEWGTNYQTFSNEDMLEMETCGVLVDLAPGKSAELEESWELIGGLNADVHNDADVERIVMPHIR